MKKIFQLVALTVAVSLLAAVPRVMAEKEIPEAARTAIDQYVAIQKALADDSMEHVAHHAKAIAKIAADHKVHQLPHKAATQAENVAKAKDIKSARVAFKELSKSFETLVRDLSDEPDDYRIAYCPMAKAGWVQTGKVIANPYYGKSMLKCGTFKR